MEPTVTDHDRLHDLVAEVIERADRLVPRLRSELPELIGRTERTFCRRLAERIDRRGLFERDGAAEFATLVEILERTVEAGTVVHVAYDWPDGYVGDEPRRIEWRTRSPETERLARDLAAARNLQQRLQHTAALVAADGVLRRLAERLG